MRSGPRKSPMRVCFFVANLGDGGAQRQCIALLNALQHDSAVEVHLILLGSGEHEDSLDVSGLSVHRTEVRNFASPAALAFVVPTLRRVRPDVLISWLHPADIWSYVATRIVRGVPWIITERGSTYPDEPVYNVRKRFGRRGAAAIIANSPPGKQLWDSLTPRSPVRVIPNMVLDGGAPSGASVDRTDSTECLFVGRLEPQKNVGAMTSAFSRFAVMHPQARLVIVGQGAETGEVVRIAEDGGVANRVDLLGFRRDVPKLMSAARLLLSFSRHEGMPNVVMEAVAAGLPAVVSDIPEHRALLGHDYPYYVRLDSPPDEAVGVIAQAWAHGPTQGERLYAHARGVLAASTPEQVVAAYVDAFAEVIDRAKANRARRMLR
ncbi:MULTISPECIES: glycosyltransferase [unclassified Mycobacterium]|uniref:glycosyltransferase n=1 Tax=unclassified Mycobacterium TaxID=2642494 RepID=UPI0029C992B8|nr:MULTISPECIES: glycosyltransferase [unclassified Mycobacterium]